MELQNIKQRFGIVGNTTGLNNALNIAIQVAPTDLTVLIHGESGVGKEVFSKVIHQSSKRKHEPIISVNCGAIPEGTIDSELFGHEKGAFTGATDNRKGYFEAVDGGTIFLDEVSEMPLSTQARLLRILESGEYLRVGSSTIQKTDVRVIAAANKNLVELVAKGKFREDLYYRLNTIPIKIPALRERGEDIHLLFRKFCIDFSDKYNSPPIQLSSNAVQVLISYSWPGNVRQLKHMAEQISVLSLNRKIEPEDLLAYLPQEDHSSFSPMLASDASKESLNEREILYRVLFDLKKDVSDLKKVVLDILHDDTSKITPEIIDSLNENVRSEAILLHENNPSSAYEPINTANQTINDADIVDESLSLADKEKELIIKALERHRGRRKEAAIDLGISERTLYRKIKEYNLTL